MFECLLSPYTFRGLFFEFPLNTNCTVCNLSVANIVLLIFWEHDPVIRNYNKKTKERTQALKYSVISNNITDDGTSECI